MWRRTKHEPIAKRRKWKFVRHTLRKDQNQITRQALEYQPTAKGSRAELKRERGVSIDREDVQKTWREAKSLAQNREEWRRLIEGLCSERNKRTKES